MLLPSSAYITPVDLNEADRLKTGRPASRTEILDRHLREHRFDTEAITPDVAQQPAISRRRQSVTAHRGTLHSAPNPVARARRGISRALITVGERIGPEAA